MTTWEIPDEPDVKKLWVYHQETGEPIMFVRGTRPGVCAGRPWYNDGSDGIHRGWYSWGELLERGPVTDVDPTPKPPKVMWSPSQNHLYLEEGAVGLTRSWPQARLEVPSDAVQLVVKEE